MIDLIVAGLCAATFSIAPHAQQLYGQEIVTSLGLLSAETGIQFSQVDGDADIDYVTAPMADGIDGTAWENGLVQLDAAPPAFPQYSIQTPRQYKSMKLRLVLHESMHSLGYMQHMAPGNILFMYLTDNPVRFGPDDTAFLNTMECKP